MEDEFTDLHFETFDKESEIFGCNRCRLMMSIIDDRLSSFFSELTNKLKQVEVRQEGLVVLASTVEEMYEFLKAALDRRETTDLKEEGAGGKNRREETLSSPPKAAMGQQMVDSSAACTLQRINNPPLQLLAQ